MDFIATGMEWDFKSQRFLAKQFYGDTLDCGQESGQGRAHGA
jgi:hypothetical protein